ELLSGDTPVATAAENKKATFSRRLTISSLGSRFSYPISQMDKLFHFPPLITAFVGFVRTVTDLPEWMLGVADYIYNHLQRFCHIPMFLSLTRQSVKDANLWED